MSPCKASAPGEVMTQSPRERTPACQTREGRLLPPAREAQGDCGLPDCQPPPWATRCPDSRFQVPLLHPVPYLSHEKHGEAGNSGDLGILHNDAGFVCVCSV